jgi:glycosyltransferase involved in cell wall biosynthesis
VFSNKTWASSAAWWFIERIMMVALSHRRCVVLFENSHDRDVLVSQGVVNAEKTIIIPGAGVDLDRFNYVPEKSDRILKILFASRLLKSKGLEALVHSVRRLNDLGIKTELHVAGIEDLNSKDSIPRACLDAWYKDGSLVWHDNVPDIERLISESNIVCLPTTYGEGIPRILIEAAACGRAVVSTLVPGCIEFVNTGVDGLLIPPDDEQALTRALKQLAIDPKKRTEMGLAGRKKVEKYYNNAIVTETTLKQYSRLLPDNTF